MSETYGLLLPSEALRPAIFGAKKRSAILRLTLGKMEKKTDVKHKRLPAKKER